MMLNPSAGAIVTGTGVEPSGSSHASKRGRIERYARSMDRLVFECRRVGGIEEGDRRRAIRDHPRDRLRGGRWRDRRGERTDPQRRHEDRGIVDRRRRDDRHRPGPGRRRDAAASRRCVRSAHRTRRKRSRSGIVRDRGLVGLRRGMRADQVGQGGEFAGEQVGCGLHIAASARRRCWANAIRVVRKTKEDEDGGSGSSGGAWRS